MAENIGKGEPSAATGEKPIKTAAVKAFDVSPEDHVEKLVDSERSGQGADDLLDNQQPVE